MIKAIFIFLGIIVSYSIAENVKYNEAKQFLINMRTCVLSESCNIENLFFTKDSIGIINYDVVEEVNDTSYIIKKEKGKLIAYLLENPFQRTWNFYDEENSKANFCFCDNGPKFIDQKTYLRKNNLGAYLFFDEKSNEEAICKCDAMFLTFIKDKNKIKIDEIWIFPAI